MFWALCKMCHGRIGAENKLFFHRSRLFYIVSEMNRKVLDIVDLPQKNKKTLLPMPVTHPKMYPTPPSQQWYTDELTGFIHSALDDTVFTNGSTCRL